MSAPQQPSTDSPATAQVTAGAVLSPEPGAGLAAQPALPDRSPGRHDPVLDDGVLDDGVFDDAVPDDAVPDVPAGAASAAPGTGGADAPGGGADELLVTEGDVAGDYLERLLDILDVDGDIDLDVEGDRASVAIVGGQLTDLVGSGGSVLDALQELTRLAVSQSTGVRSRLMLDIGGFRAQRRSDLSALAAEAAARVAKSRQPERLSPMNPFERKVVHDVVAAVDGVHSESEGEEPARRVVILPGS